MDRVPVYAPGSTIVRREVFRGRVWLKQPVSVVSDDGVVLAVLVVPGSPLTFPDHPDPHPWRAVAQWRTTHVLQLYRSDDHYSVWKLFQADAFLGWYVNFERPIRRSKPAFDTRDYGLDLVITPTGAWHWKDVEDLDALLATGRMSSQEVADVRAAAAEVTDELTRGLHWWAAWDDWAPPPDHFCR